MQQDIKKLQWFEYLKVAFLEILNTLLCRVFANQVTNIQLNINKLSAYYQHNGIQKALKQAKIREKHNRQILEHIIDSGLKSIHPQGGDTPLYRVLLSLSMGQSKVNSQVEIFSIVNSQGIISL